MSTSPVRIDKELFAEAQSAGARNSRSAAQQIAHWARLGRAVENSPDISQRAVQEVLAGEAPYDDLNDEQQAVVRSEWEKEIERRRNALDLAAEFEADNQAWAELDDAGNVVRHERNGLAG